MSDDSRLVSWSLKKCADVNRRTIQIPVVVIGLAVKYVEELLDVWWPGTIY